MEGDMRIVTKVEAVVNAGIPVVAHIGLTPQTAAMLGGFKVQGKSSMGAEKLLREAVAMEQAGAFAIVLECIPAPLAKLIDEKLISARAVFGFWPANQVNDDDLEAVYKTLEIGSKVYIY